MLWYVCVKLDAPATKEQAAALAKGFGHTYVDGKRTEVTFHTVQKNMKAVFNDSVDAIHAFVIALGFDGRVQEIQIKPSSVRMEELAAQGITEESIKE